MRSRWPALLALALLVVWGLPILFAGQSLFLAGWADLHPSLRGPAQSAPLVHEMLASGVWPLWNPFNALGAPLAVDLPGIYTPFHWLPFAWPTLASWELLFLFRFWVCGLGLFLFFRSLGIAPWISFGGALLYTFNGHHIVFGNAWHMNTVAFIPFMLWGLNESLALGRRTRGAAIVALSWCLMIVGSGLVDLVLAALLTIFVVLAWCAMGPKTPSARARMWHVGTLATAALLGLGMAAVFVVPLLELRNEAVPPIVGRSTGHYNSLAYGLSLFYHRLSEVPEDASNHWMKATQFFSILVATSLVLCAGSASAISRAQRPFAAALAGFSILYLMKLYGLIPYDAFTGVPLLEHVKFEKYQATLQICMHALMAMGVDAALRDVRGQRVTRSIIAAACVGLLPIAHLVVSTSHPITGGDVLSAGGYAAIVVTFCAVVFGLRRGHSRLLIAAGCVVFAFAAWFDQPAGFLRAARPITPSDPMIEWLKRETTSGLPSRVFDAANASPNSLQPHGLHDVCFYSDSLLPGYRRLFRDHVARGTVKNGISVMASRQYPRLDHELLAFMGVSHYRVVPGTKPAAGHRAGPLAGVVVGSDPAPRAYVVHDVRFGVEQRGWLARILRAPDEMRRSAWVEAPPPPDAPRGHAREVAQHVEMIEYGYDHVVIEVDTDERGMLILLDQFFPGWVATVDGQPARVWPVNHLFRGVLVEPGRSHVVFAYEPVSFELGLVLSAIASASLVAMLVLLHQHERA